MKRLENTVITGASTGIGQASAKVSERRSAFLALDISDELENCR